MAIKFATLTGVTTTTSAEGVVTTTAVLDEKSAVSGLLDAAMVPFGISNGDEFISKSTAAAGSYGTFVLGAYLLDIMHGKSGAAPKLPFASALV